MEPSFADGDLVLIEPVGVRRFGKRRRLRRRLRIGVRITEGDVVGGAASAPKTHEFETGVRITEGDVVIARHPFKKLDIIKFVSEIHEDNHLTVRSPSGDDSRQFGRVPFSTVKGRVTANLTQRMVIRASGSDFGTGDQLAALTGRRKIPERTFGTK